MSEHTPGPWLVELDPDGGFIITNGPGAKDGTWVLAGRQPIAHRADVSHANAHLIAAAPDLKAVAIATALFFADTDSPLGARARAAILKAEGLSNV